MASRHCGLIPLDRGQEDQHHQRDLEVDVDQHDPEGEVVVPGCVEQVAARRADRRAERERERDAAELRQHARARDRRLADEPVRVAEWRSRTRGPRRAARRCTAESPLSWIECQKYPRTVSCREDLQAGEVETAVVEDRSPHHDAGGQQQEDADVGEERDGADPGERDPPIPLAWAGARLSDLDAGGPHLSGGPDQEIALVQFASR